MGALAARFPVRLRSFASARTWRNDPDRAETYQRPWAYGIAATVVAFGLVVVGIGATSG